MRNSKEIKQLILDTASSDIRIRAVLINGSRANDKIKPDKYQDFDLVFIVDAIDTFLVDHEWTNIFGKKILWQLPDEMTIGLEEKRDAFTYLMVFEDGNRLDLTLFPKNKLATTFRQDSLTKVWLDKDNLFADLPTPSDRDYLIKCPSEKEFKDICNEFWWVCPYVAKALMREEIIHAKEIMEIPVRNMFKRIIRIHIGIETNFSVSAGKGERFIKNYLPESEYKNILRTYPDHDSQAIIQAMQLMMELFSNYARHSAQHLKYAYNLVEEKQSLLYFQALLNEENEAG